MPKYQYSGILVIVYWRIISWTWVVFRSPLILSPVDSSVLLVQLSVVFAHAVGKLVLEGETRLGFLGFVAIFCTINQTWVVPTGMGGISSSWGSGEAEMNPKRKSREYNFILSLLAGTSAWFPCLSWRKTGGCGGQPSLYIWFRMPTLSETILFHAVPRKALYLTARGLFVSIAGVWNHRPKRCLNLSLPCSQKAVDTWKNENLDFKIEQDVYPHVLPTKS